MATTAWPDRHRLLCHWDKFFEDRLRDFVRDKCSLEERMGLEISRMIASASWRIAVGTG